MVCVSFGTLVYNPLDIYTQEVPFASVERLLGWQAQDAAVLSSGTVRTLVKRHGQLIRQVEQAEAAILLERAAPGELAGPPS